MTTTIAPQIAAFAAAVRDALADLPDEERDELTEGLEADLSEAYAEDLTNTLPDPVEYATELRQAAGLPVREESTSSMLSGLAEGWRRTRGDVMSALRRNPALVSVLDFGAALRPVWWVARAWVATWLLSAVFGSEGGFVPAPPPWFGIFVALTIVSVQWGRGRWHFAGLPPLLVIGNLAAVVLLLPTVVMADSYDGKYAEAYSDAMGQDDSWQPGLYSNGTAVRNIYAYNADGKPLAGVQLFDQDGRPLEVLLAPEVDECLDDQCRIGYRLDDEGGYLEPVPARLTTGRSVFNVFPLSLLPVEEDLEAEPGAVEPTGEAAVPPAPFEQVPAVDLPKSAKKVSDSND